MVIFKLHLPQKLAVRCGVDVETIHDRFATVLLDEGIALEGTLIPKISEASEKLAYGRSLARLA